MPTLSWCGSYLRYIPFRYPHYYHRIAGSFEDYVNGRMKRKVRKNIQRYIRKFMKRFGCNSTWKFYQSVEEIEEFFPLACQVARRTYQAQWLNVGLTDSKKCFDQSKYLAKRDRIRCGLLFADCYFSYPITDDGILVMKYGGSDPDYRSWSPSYILDFYLLQSLYADRTSKVKLIDLSQGEGLHKRSFSTQKIDAADVYFFKCTSYLVGAVLMHWFTHFGYQISREILKKHKLDKVVRRWLRGH